VFQSLTGTIHTEIKDRYSGLDQHVSIPHRYDSHEYKKSGAGRKTAVVSIPHRYDSHIDKILSKPEYQKVFQSLTGTIHTW